MRPPTTAASRLCLLGALLSVVVAGCATTPYDEARDDWTRSDKQYDVLDGQMQVFATLKTAPFRRAYVDRYSQVYALTETQTKTLLAAELEENDRALVVLVAFWVHKSAWDDLNPARGYWEVRLQGQSGDYAHPFKVTRMKRRSPAQEALFPHVTAQHTLYELHFDRTTIEGRPLADSGQRLELIVAGAPAQARLSWTMP